MKVCFPTQHNEGIESTVFNHFGSAPTFVVVNAATREVTSINNRDLHHTHGACNPLKALSGERVDAIVVGGIGAGALNKLNQMGITVYRAMAPTIAGNMELFEKNSLPVLTMQQCCSGHSADGSCAH
jgi:predicted Fe-Mo cluster-binding NifX family protein